MAIRRDEHLKAVPAHRSARVPRPGVRRIAGLRNCVERRHNRAGAEAVIWILQAYIDVEVLVRLSDHPRPGEPREVQVTNAGGVVEVGRRRSELCDRRWRRPRPERAHRTVCGFITRKRDQWPQPFSADDKTAQNADADKKIAAAEPQLLHDDLPLLPAHFGYQGAVRLGRGSRFPPPENYRFLPHRVAILPVRVTPAESAHPVAVPLSKCPRRESNPRP